MEQILLPRDTESHRGAGQKVDIEAGPRVSLKLLSQRETIAPTVGPRSAKLQDLCRRGALALQVRMSLITRC